MLESRHLNNNSTHHLLLKNLTPKQQLNIKGFTVNTNNRLNRVFSSFNPLNNEFSPGDRLIDIFPSYFYFYFMDRKSKECKKAHICKIDELTLWTLADSKTAICYELKP